MAIFVDHGRSCSTQEVPEVKRRRVDASLELKHPQQTLQISNGVCTGRSTALHTAVQQYGGSFNNPSHCIDLQAGFDMDPYNEGNALTRNQALHISWREIERSMPAHSFGLSFEENREAEQIRTAGMESILNYVQRKDLSQSTLHLAATYANRLFYHYVVEKSSENLPPLCLYSSIATALRTAVKIQERWEHTEPFRLNPNHIWSVANLGGPSGHIENSVDALNQIERLHLSILANEPVYVPVAVDFLEQYLAIGGWPAKSVDDYRRLGLFLLALSLFVTGSQNLLQGVLPSKLAAAALILSVKIINTDSRATAYEFWTKKLEMFTRYSITDLQPVVHSLSRLLRRRQSKVKSDVFSAMFPVWSKFSWS